MPKEAGQACRNEGRERRERERPQAGGWQEEEGTEEINERRNGNMRSPGSIAKEGTTLR